MLRSRLFRRYWLATSFLVTLLLCSFGAIEGWLGFRQNFRHLSEVQQLEARAAAREIELALAGVREPLRELARLPWDRGLLTDADRQQEFHRLQKLVPAVFELRAVDGDGRERVFVSRTAPDRIGSGMDLSADPLVSTADPALVNYGAVHFRNLAEPFVAVAVRERIGARAVTIAELDLRHIAGVVKDIKVGQSGKAFIVDPANRVIAHPSLSLTLSRVDLSAVDQVAAVRRAIAKGAEGELVSVSAKNHAGEDVLTTAVAIDGPAWVLVVEQPLAEAMWPVRAALFRTLGLLAVGLVASFAISSWLARRLARPVLSLRDGAMRLGKGDLAARLSLDTNDELAAVAEEFNRMAERLQQSYAGLETTVRERTRELGMRKEEADRANAAKTRFLASASHDLRQPMHAISLLVGILGERTHDAAVRPLVEKVQLSVQSMENLFNSLLDISRLDAGAVNPNVADFDIGGLLRLIEVNYAALAKEKGLELTVVHSRAAVRSDPALLERIASNLVSNAIRYTERGRILVGCRRQDGLLQLLVIDTGIGIPAASLADVFDEFFQLANPERDRSKGLGLGLSIVKRSAELLGHRLIVRSVPGKGSTFGVEIPRAAAAGQVPGFAAATAGGGHMDGAFVLVIDDDRESRTATELLFGEWGCHVVGAGSADEAAARLDEHLRAPDLVVSDYRLRDGLTGVAAVRTVRAQTEQAIPAIIVTGDLAAADAGQISAAGFALLHKPVNPETLRKAAEGLLAAATRTT